MAVEVVDESGASTLINAATIESVAKAQNGDVTNSIMPMLALAKASLKLTDADRLTLAPPVGGAPKWSDACIPNEIRDRLHTKLEDGDVTAIRVPLQIRKKAGEIDESYFDIFLQRDSSVSEGQAVFIREGIIIAAVRPRRISGVRAIIVVEDRPLATFLGDSENPSHTEWQKELVRDKYSFHAATIEYVAQSVPSILSLLSKDDKKPDTSLLIDLFSLPTDQDAAKKIQARKKDKKGDEPDEADPDLQATPKRFAIQKVSGGFTIRRGGPVAARPPMLALKVAYGVRRGSPFTKYNPADFRLGLGDIHCQLNGCEVSDFADNWMLIKVDSDDFEAKITGFDGNRDLHIDVKVKEQELADAASS